MSCVYILTNKINNKVYIGQTTNTFNNRFRSHVRASRSKIVKRLIDRAIDKYGVNNFDIYFYECNVEDLDYLETELIKILNSTNLKRGYNLESGGNKFKKHSEETKRKMSVAKIGNKIWLGRKHSASTRKKQSDSHKGDKNPMYGKKLLGEKNGMFGKGYIQTGDKNPMFGKTPWNKKQHKEKI